MGDMGMRPSQAEWHVRPAQPDDADGIVDLLNTVFGHWGDRHYWKWKYQMPPAPFRLSSAVADLNGHIVGHFGIVPLIGVLGGKEIRCAQTVDAAVLPAYRRCGIHSTLGRYVLGSAARAGVTWLYAFPGLFSLSLDQRLGYRSVAFVPEMVRILRPRQAVMLTLRLLPGDMRALWMTHRQMPWSPETTRRLARLRRSLLLLASWVTDPVLAKRRQSPKFEIVEHDLAEGFDARFDTLWAQVCDSISLGIRKDANYLTWRYCANPRKCYRILVAKQGRELAGLLVLRQSRRMGEIAELMALPDHIDAVSSLLMAAVSHARRGGGLVLSAWSPAEHPYHASFRRAGFVSQRRLHSLSDHCPATARWLYQVADYARHLPPSQQKQLAEHTLSWSLTMGDSDLV